ncbi:hypothetical protein MES5069_30251 [Mesorhizobium escarrei]|uniref:Uncharacterized protein n=1 Tax=Mesorhizobium escarrei TaxID=666018 RepID=A0ABM9DZ47_9HYPH|nr:hypothetical protein MES5069_30251 [Mesorhizobium escarrei]
MSVAAGWKVISHGAGWAAWADAPVNSVAAALARSLAPAKNFLIAVINSQFLAIGPQEYRTTPGRESRKVPRLVQTILYLPLQERSGGNRAAFLRASAAAHLAAAAAVAARWSASGGVSGQNAPGGRNSGEFGREKRTNCLGRGRPAVVSSFTCPWRGLKCRDSQWSRHELLALGTWAFETWALERWAFEKLGEGHPSRCSV